MTSAAIPFVNIQASGNSELAGMSPIAMNVVVDKAKCVRRRPGVATSAAYPLEVVNVSAAISGIYSTNHGQIFAISELHTYGERLIYQLGLGGATLLGGGLSPNGLCGTMRPVFAETELLLVIAGGDLVQKIVLSGPTSARLSTTGVPLSSSHIVALAGRLIANDTVTDRTANRFSGIAFGSTSYAENENWAYAGIGTSGYFTAEARPDDVVALAVKGNQALIFGTGSVQTYQPDPSIDFAPIALMESGVAAPYSVVIADGDMFWLDHARRFILSDGRGFQVISDPIKSDLDAIVNVSDCYGFRVLMGFLDAIVWVFPSDGRTFVFQKGSGWGQWSGWDDTTNNWAPFTVNCHQLLPAYAPGGTRTSSVTNLVGTLTGKVGELSFDSATDLTSGLTGSRVRAFVRTGFQNRGTDKRKRCERIYVKMARGTPTADGPHGFIRYQDQPGAWSDPLPVDLGPSGDTEPVVVFPSLSVYRTREWEFEFASTEALSLVSVEEVFTVLND